MLKINKLFPLFILLAFIRCGVLRNDINYDDLPDGEYRSKVFSKGKVYVKKSSDSLIVYKLNKINGQYVADTLKSSLTYFPARTNQKIKSTAFKTTSFDFDGLTIPFKYRPETHSLPQQFTTSLNGAVYLGMRQDRYRLKYRKHFFNYYERQSQRFAFSLGCFTGFGSTAMNPWVTDYNISSEYEGVVWLKGVAFIVAVGKYTSGVSVGWDNLLDKNKKYWIYEKKPWIGLVFGLNLN